MTQPIDALGTSAGLSERPVRCAAVQTRTINTDTAGFVARWNSEDAWSPPQDADPVGPSGVTDASGTNVHRSPRSEPDRAPKRITRLLYGIDPILTNHRCTGVYTNP